MQHKRIDALSGIAFAALAFIGIAAGGDFRISRTPFESVEPYFSGGGVLLGIFAIPFAAVGLIWFAGGLRVTLHRAERVEGRLAHTAFGGAAVAAGLMLVATAVQAVAFFRAFEMGDYPADESARSFEMMILFFADLHSMLLVISINHVALWVFLGWVTIVSLTLARTDVFVRRTAV